ncbi:MAG TPA: protein kinase [Gemmatimonadaceae bacterium]|nr:protein kinase [Gemmatimonadaceae bacterium]
MPEPSSAPQPDTAAEYTPLSPPPDPIASLRTALRGHYEFESELGQGAYATVYLARDLKHERKVAIKVLHADPNSELGELRFIREIRMLARLQHPNILPLHDSGHVEALLYYVMPYVSGETLRDRLRAEHHLSWDRACSITRELADALAYAHGQGIIHRDIKPENVLLSAGHPMLADFGVARAIDIAGVRQLTRTGTGSPGTPAYMSPEQLLGEKEIDARSDTYSLGCVLFEMLTGEPPFSGKEGFVNRFTEAPPSPTSFRKDLPHWIDSVAVTALARSPDDRFQTAQDFARALSSPDAKPAPIEFVKRVERDSHPAPRRAILTYAVAIVAMVAIAALLFRFVTKPSAPSEASRNSIAVLPFVGPADTAEEYFADGMTDQLIANLSSVPGLSVASRTSAFTFKDRKNVSAGDIGQALHVNNLLEGSVRRSGNRLRVLVQLTDARDGHGIWSANFEAANSDVFAVQDSISNAILERLRVRLTAGPTQFSARGTSNIAAYDFYLKGRHEFNKFDEPSLRKSITMYNAALDVDPQYAQAWAGIAESWIFLADDYVAPKVAYPAAKRAAQEALRYDTALSDAHAALGVALYQYEWNLAEGRHEIDKALALDPHSFLAQLALHGLLIATDKPDSALSVLKTAQASDPLSVLNALLLGRFYGIVGRPQESIDEYQRAIQLAPPVAPIAMAAIGEALITQRRYAQADSVLAQARQMLGPDMDFLLAQSEAARGRRAEAVRLLAKYEARARATYVRPELIAAVYVRLGDKDNAFQWLEKAYDARSPYLLALRVDRQWDPLREDPRFRQLVSKIGLP